MGKVISVWGAPDTGKTTLSIKLAKQLSKDCTVMLVFADILSPVIPTVIPSADNNKSLGNVLSAPTLSTDDILKNSISIKENRNIGILGYAQGNNTFTFPQYSDRRAVEFISKLREISDYTIIDLTSNFVTDMLTTTSLEYSDEVIRVSSPSLKDVSYYDSYMPLISANKFSVDNHINVISKFMENDAIEECAELYNAEERIPYIDELREQSMCGELFYSLSPKNEQTLKNTLENLIYIIDYEENMENDKISHTEDKKGIFSMFKGFRKREA